MCNPKPPVAPRLNTRPAPLPLPLLPGIRIASNRCYVKKLTSYVKKLTSYVKKLTSYVKFFT